MAILNIISNVSENTIILHMIFNRFELLVEFYEHLITKVETYFIFYDIKLAHYNDF